MEQSVREMLDPSLDFFTKIVMESDLTDLSYLYRYGEYISSSELQVAEYLNSLPEEQLERMNSIRRDREPEMLYPTYFETVYYGVHPETGADQLCLKACAKGDSPIAKGHGQVAASSVAVIGSACGPTSIFVAGNVRSELHMKSICSPLFFEPTPVREWYVTYFMKRREDLQVELHTV